MNNKVETPKIVLIIIITIILILSLGALFYININKNKPTDIEATITYLNKDYLIATTSNNQEYRLKNQDIFQKGDKVLFTITQIDTTKSPVEAQIIDAQLLSRSVNFTISDPVAPSETTTSQENNSTTTNTPTTQTEEQVLQYLNTTNEQLDNSQTLTQEIKEKFITIIDFIFYNQEISGYTFSQLTTSAKLQVLKLALVIDKKIETQFPNYKEQVSTKYQNTKSKLLEKYLDLTVEVCQNNQETCSSAKEGLKDLKENFNLTWSTLKEIASTGLTKLKSWYEVWRTI